MKIPFFLFFSLFYLFTNIFIICIELKSNPICRLTGLQVLAFFVTDMNLPSQALKNISKNRKTGIIYPHI